MVDEPVLDSPWDDCPKKHFVRRHGWVEAGIVRKIALFKNVPKSRRRQLRLFTFCAAGAVDVYTLKLADIVTTDTRDLFTAVSFCERDSGVEAYIRRALPGAIPFIGEFENLVLLPEEYRALAVDPAYDPQTSGDYSAKDREIARRIIEHREFKESFPYDILNLDFCGYFYKNREPFPGKLFQALRQVMKWQRESVVKGGAEFISGFTLLLTTSLGPTDLADAYERELVSCIASNLEANGELGDILEGRFGIRDAAQLFAEQFEEFFILALPKIITRLLLQEDWFVDHGQPFQVYSFDRSVENTNDVYKMLHIVFQVKRQDPPREARGLGDSVEATEAYTSVVRSIFEGNVVNVDLALSDDVKNEMLKDLDRVKTHAIQYQKG